MGLFSRFGFGFGRGLVDELQGRVAGVQDPSVAVVEVQHEPSIFRSVAGAGSTLFLASVNISEDGRNEKVLD